MNQAMNELLCRKYCVDYIGPVSPKPSFWQHAFSKTRRVLGLRGDFFYFSERRLEAIRSEVEERLRESASELAVFHGFAPWIHTIPKMPYIAWSDCTFWQYVHIYHDANCFRKSDLVRIMDREAAWLRNAERVIFRNAWAASSAIREYHLNPSQVAVVGNYGFIVPPAADIYSGPADFLMITTNFRQKGGAIALEAFRQVHEAHPDSRLLIVGDQPDKKMLREPGVVYLGWIDKSDPSQQNLLTQTFAQAMCILHPTTADTNPMVLIEAGYFGCPAISTRCFAIPELVVDGISGLLLQNPTDVPALVKSMKWMLQRGESYFRMRVATRSHMLGYYTRDAFQHRLSSEIAAVAAHIDNGAL